MDKKRKKLNEFKPARNINIVPLTPNPVAREPFTFRKDREVPSCQYEVEVVGRVLYIFDIKNMLSKFAYTQKRATYDK